MFVEEIYINRNVNSCESELQISEVIDPKKIVPLTEALLHERHCNLSADVQELMKSFEQRLQDVEAKVERLHEICEECTQSVQVECGSELTSVVSSILPSETEEAQERQILKYIVKEEGSKDMTMVPTESLTELYDRMMAEKKVREANFRRMRRNQQFRDLLLNGVIVDPSSCKRLREELPTSCSKGAPEEEKVFATLNPYTLIDGLIMRGITFRSASSNEKRAHFLTKGRMPEKSRAGNKTHLVQSHSLTRFSILHITRRRRYWALFIPSVGSLNGRLANVVVQLQNIFVLSSLCIL